MLADISFTKIIKPFIKPKWKHRNPQTRKQAIEELKETDQDIFYDIAIHDTDKSVQTMAIEKINNLDVLGQLITQQTHKELLAGDRKSVV